jgi:hypothetical protein
METLRGNGGRRAGQSMDRDPWRGACGIHRGELGRQVLFLETDVGGGTVTVRVHDLPAIDPESLIDAEINVRGVCGTKFNGRRQFIGLRVFVERFEDIRIERAPPPDA